MFSIITTEPSTINPKSIAPRLIRLPEMPAFSMPVNANNIDNGIADATIRPPRTLPSSSSRTATTRMPPSSRFLETVQMVLFTRVVRS